MVSFVRILCQGGYIILIYYIHSIYLVSLKMLIMNKFTDFFFEFPIKVYDSQSLKKAEEEEDSLNIPREADWVSGRVRIHVDDIKAGIYYQDWFSGRSVEEVDKEGFDQTAIWINSYGEFICLWPLRKFEEKLNSFMVKHPEPEKEENLEI